MADRAIVATGIGAVTCAGFGVPSLRDAMWGATDFEMRLPDAGADSSCGRPLYPLRQPDFVRAVEGLGAAPALQERLTRVGHRASRSVQASLLAVGEAWIGAGLHEEGADPERISIVVGGSNLSQREHARLSAAAGRPRPMWAVQCLDTDHVGSLSEAFGIRGEGFTVGGASASGNVALIHGLRALKTGAADVCIVVGAMMDLSGTEYAALEAAGALATARSEAGRCNHPFDVRHGGFVHGEGAGAVVLDARAGADREVALGRLAAGTIVLDGHRFTDPSIDGEAAAMRKTLRDAGLAEADVDYVNAHGTGAPKGDRAELAALDVVFGAHAERLLVNSTKSVIGHTLCAAGVLESIAVLVQLREGWVHPMVDFRQPISTRHQLVGERVTPGRLDHALSNSFGFGGVNTAVLWSRVAT